MTKRGGFSLVELVIAIAILGIVVVSTMQAFRFISTQGVNVSERSFATQKVIQMMEELRGLVEQDNGQVTLLDNYDNNDPSNPFKYTLSVRAEVNGTSGGGPAVGDQPGEYVSGNTQYKGNWKYRRTVRVMDVPGEPLARRVYVRLYRTTDGEVLAETASVLRTLRGQLFPTQVFDVFLLDVENVPGWWVSLSSLGPAFDNMVTDLKLRNPGLDFRVHKITRLAYGRDPYYHPYINDAASPTNTVSPGGVYFLPGNIDGSLTLFEPDTINARLNVGGSFVHDESDGTLYPYSMADQYNHAVRKPDEDRMYREHFLLAKASGQTLEPSYRMLLDRMNEGPGQEPDGTPYDYTNILLINLHGEMMPFPPLRNYSDPAKRPTAATAEEQQVRAVSHPEKLHYNAGAEVRLRVYSFVANPNDTAVHFPDNNSAVTSFTTMTVTVTSTGTLNTAIQAALLAGGVELLAGNSGVDYSWGPAPLNPLSGTTGYSVSLLGSTQTVVTLYKSPVRHFKRATNDMGLATGDKLYGLEYIPSVVNGTSFSDVFTQPNAAGTLAEDNAAPKNTARWVIKFPAALLADGITAFETRIGLDLTTGISTEPANISRTYAWVGTTVPITEQSQFLGDPRHMPYADVKQAKKFNWFFRNDTTGAGYDGFTKDDGTEGGRGGVPGYQGWNNQDVPIDVPRFYEVLRKGLLKTTGLMNSIVGQSFYYIGIGGEMGANVDLAATYANGLPVINRPWLPTDGTSKGVDEISQWGGSAPNTDIRLIAHSADGTATTTDWVGINWIGELYPPEASSVWVSQGNLPVGNTLTTNDWTDRRYFRAKYGINDSGPTNGYHMYTQDLGQLFPTSFVPRKEPNENGISSFLNGNTTGAGSNFADHDANANTANLTAAGTAIMQDFNIPLVPSMTSPNKHRYFTLNKTPGTGPDEWDQNTYLGQRTTLTLMEPYYDSSNAGYVTSGLVQMTEGGRYAYVLPNGVSPQVSMGTNELGKLSLAALTRGFMAMGAPAVIAGNITPLPLVTIASPTVTAEFANPATIPVVWSSTWTRWDGQLYTAAYPAGFASAAPVTYNVKVSLTDGRTWKCAGNTGVDATAGVMSSDPACVQTSPFSWSVPSGTYPTGQYILRIEAFLPPRRLHYAFHTRRVFIRR